MLGMLLGLMADAVFESVTSMRRAFDSEMRGYLDRRGFRSAPDRTHTR